MSARKLALAALALCACRQLDVPGGQAPVIASFAAQPATLVAGESSALTWQITGATNVSIDNGVGDVSAQTSAVSSRAWRTTKR